MNDEQRQIDAEIDAVLETMTDVAPPPDHVARVLAATADVEGPESARRLPWRERRGTRRWLAIAASLVATFGAVWGVVRVTAVDGSAWPSITTAEREVPHPGHPLDLPVLPPEAYWGMDAFEEWARLHPHPTRSTPPLDATHQRRVETRTRGAAPQETARMTTLAPEPPIEVAPITPAPIELAPMQALEDIVVAEIAVAPIVLTPVDAEEKP